MLHKDKARRQKPHNKFLKSCCKRTTHAAAVCACLCVCVYVWQWPLSRSVVCVCVRVVDWTSFALPLDVVCLLLSVAASKCHAHTLSHSMTLPAAALSCPLFLSLSRSLTDYCQSALMNLCCDFCASQRQKPQVQQESEEESG